MTTSNKVQEYFTRSGQQDTITVKMLALIGKVLIFTKMVTLKITFCWAAITNAWY